MRQLAWVLLAACGGGSTTAPVSNVSRTPVTATPAPTFCELLEAHHVDAASKVIRDMLAQAHVDVFIALQSWSKQQPCSLGAEQQGDRVHLIYKIGENTNYGCDTKPALQPFTMSCKELIDI